MPRDLSLVAGFPLAIRPFGAQYLVIGEVFMMVLHPCGEARTPVSPGKTYPRSGSGRRATPNGLRYVSWSATRLFLYSKLKFYYIV